MDKHWQRVFEIWARRPEHKQLVSCTLDRMHKLIEGYKCVVCFSGGKDSTVMLHLALQADPEIQVFHWDYGSQLMPREFEEEILANARRIGAKKLLVKSSPRFERPDARGDATTGFWYQTFWLSLNATRRAEAWDCQFVGLRRQEGCKRSATIKGHRRKGEVYPLADWTWLDVWGYIVSHGLPYPKAYDLYAPLLGYDRVRFATFFDMEFEKFGTPCLDGFLLPGKRNLG